MKVTYKLDGADELRSQLKKMGRDADRALEAAATIGAQVLQAAANHDAPGPHIEVETVESSRKRAVVHIGPDKDHWYYKFFETGVQAHPISGSQWLRWFEGSEPVFARSVQHKGMAAKPFMRPAFDTKKDRARDRAGAALRRRLGL